MSLKPTKTNKDLFYVPGVIYELYEWAVDPTYGKHTRKWLPTATPCDSVKTWDKNNIGLIIRLVTGHGPFRYHIFKCEPDKDPICDLCEEDDQTANHLILECPALSDIRRNNTDFWSVIMNASPTNIVTDTKMEVLLDFVLNTNVLNSAFQLSGGGNRTNMSHW